MDPSAVKIPPMLDLTDENITSNTHIVNSQGSDKRFQYLMTRLITHLHEFSRETRLTTDEWMGAINFLTACGQMCTDTRQEFILLSDTLGLSMLIDSMNHPKPQGATEGTVLGPFHTHDAIEYEHGDSICSAGKGEPMLVKCTLKDTDGKPVVGASIDIWETDDTGHYDTQYEGREGPDCRGILHSTQDGFWFKGIRPVPYPVPTDGPVGIMLRKLQRHAYRPSHMHFKINAPGFDELITALFIRGDHYETSDAVFGVKSSLIVDIIKVTDPAMAAKYGMKAGDWLLEKDFVIITDEQSRVLREKQAIKALRKLGSNAKLVDGLPVAEDLD
jgi:protocatechuate 3,4-dioxygenase beta subunit